MLAPAPETAPTSVLAVSAAVKATVAMAALVMVGALVKLIFIVLPFAGSGRVQNAVTVSG